MALDSHHNLLQGGVACTLTQAVDCNLHLTRTILYGSQRVGRSHTEVVVAVC